MQLHNQRLQEESIQQVNSINYVDLFKQSAYNLQIINIVQKKSPDNPRKSNVISESF